MDKSVFIALVFMLTNNAYSQGYVNATKSASKNNFASYVDKKKLNTITKETDSTLIFLVRDTAVQNVDIRLHFDSLGKCDSEETTLSCDSCYNILLSSTLNNKYYRWTKVDNNTYFARFPYRLILTTGLDNPFSFLVSRSNLTGQEYRRIVKNALNK